jgi:hypothetical protein
VRDFFLPLVLLRSRIPVPASADPVFSSGFTGPVRYSCFSYAFSSLPRESAPPGRFPCWLPAVDVNLFMLLITDSC